MNLFDAVRQRRSVRQFKPGQVPDEDLKKILDAGRLAPSGYNLQNKEFVVVRDPKVIAQFNTVQKSFDNVPVVIAIVMTPSPTPSGGSFWIEDCAACVENMLLAATALGYASVWVEGTLHPKETWAKQLLGIPADKRLFVMLPIGHPAEPGEMAPKRPLDEIVHTEKYGRQ